MLLGGVRYSKSIATADVLQTLTARNNALEAITIRCDDRALVFNWL